MPKRLDAVDPMVLALKGQVEGHLAMDVQFRFNICVSEALTNLVLHARSTDPDAQVDIALATVGEDIVIEIFDPPGAAAFDLREKAAALSEVDLLAEGGRGLGLILECADRVDYGAEGDRNRLRLAFRGRE
ncbi:ATP-binding protein [Pseudooceanicola algae]|nr:ATP-binding protein [Pseudooceanicola algae]